MPFTPEPFDQLLRDKIMELEQHEAEQEALANDPVELLRLAALRSLARQTARTLPFHSPGSYEPAKTDKLTAEPHKLDLVF